jgi:5-methylcytosine-specific restriction endonuclease McrA
MTRYKQIVFTDADKDLLKDVRACTGKWSTALDPIIRLRERLKELQNCRCVYCQAPIEADEIGYRELEHILPKGKSSRCTVKSGTSNDPKRRRATLGYAEFQFEPLNLAISCSQCNTLKGMYDGLAERSQKRPLQAYPESGKYFIWYHPHYDSYATHIKIDDDFGFEGLTDGGKAVVHHCGLDRAEVLVKKFQARANARARHSRSVKNALDALASGVNELAFSKEQAAQSLATTHGIAPAVAFDLVRRRLTATTAIKLEALYQECKKYEKPTN